MRLFLDAHVSGRRLAQGLRSAGHDVRAADEERALDGMEDADLLALTTGDRRILVTFNLKDFLPLLRDYGEAGRSHSGCIVVASSLRHEHLGAIITGVARALMDVPGPDDWIDRVYWLSQAGARD